MAKRTKTVKTKTKATFSPEGFEKVSPKCVSYVPFNKISESILATGPSDYVYPREKIDDQYSLHGTFKPDDKELKVDSLETFNKALVGVAHETKSGAVAQISVGGAHIGFIADAPFSSAQPMLRTEDFYEMLKEARTETKKEDYKTSAFSLRAGQNFTIYESANIVSIGIFSHENLRDYLELCRKYKAQVKKALDDRTTKFPLDTPTPDSLYLGGLEILPVAFENIMDLINTERETSVLEPAKLKAPIPKHYSFDEIVEKLGNPRKVIAKPSPSPGEKKGRRKLFRI